MIFEGCSAWPSRQRSDPDTSGGIVESLPVALVFNDISGTRSAAAYYPIMPASLDATEQAVSITTPPPSELPFRPLTVREMLAWGAGAIAAFHLAYEFCPPLILVFLLCLFRLAHVATRPRAMYAGWILGLAIYAPQLTFFWNIFGFGAVALWLVLATWLSLYLVLQRFALVKLGPHFGAVVAPFLWTGLEYFRSELYYLRFSWLNVGYAFSSFPREALLPWLGMYGTGCLLMAFAAQFSLLRKSTPGRRCILFATLAGLLLAGNLLSLPRSGPSPTQLAIAGVQLEFPDDTRAVSELDRLLAKYPATQLFVLSEYSFPGPIPPAVRNWCAQNRKYLVAGGKDYLDDSETKFRNTAFVIGPEGKEVFKQTKSVPIQFFQDGEPALGQNLWHSPWGKIGLCVCYDLSYTRVTDALIRQGAQAIIVPTMDVEEWGRRQHLLHARVAPTRAAEYRVPIFRLCSSGISQAVTRHGTVLATAPFPGQGEPLHATLELPPSGGSLPFDRFLAWPCVAVCAFFLAWHIISSVPPALNLNLNLAPAPAPRLRTALGGTSRVAPTSSVSILMG
jgi:apolipoprotein N-acyltransferase